MTCILSNEEKKNHYTSTIIAKKSKERPNDIKSWPGCKATGTLYLKEEVVLSHQKNVISYKMKHTISPRSPIPVCSCRWKKTHVYT
jgi:hypothetical protein